MILHIRSECDRIRTFIVCVWGGVDEWMGGWVCIYIYKIFICIYIRFQKNLNNKIKIKYIFNSSLANIRSCEIEIMIIYYYLTFYKKIREKIMKNSFIRIKQ